MCLFRWKILFHRFSFVFGWKCDFLLFLCYHVNVMCMGAEQFIIPCRCRRDQGRVLWILPWWVYTCGKVESWKSCGNYKLRLNLLWFHATAGWPIDGTATQHSHQGGNVVDSLCIIREFYNRDKVVLALISHPSKGSKQEEVSI